MLTRMFIKSDDFEDSCDLLGNSVNVYIVCHTTVVFKKTALFL